MNKKKVVIIGAGFAGISAAQKLARSEAFSVVVVSPKSHFEYYPGLYRVLGDQPPFEVFVPFRYMLSKNTTFLHDSVVKLDIPNKQVFSEKGTTLSYDILIIATGMITSDFGIPGVNQYAQFITSLASIKVTKNILEEKVQEHIISKKETPFTVVLAGAGPTGVETAGEVSLFFDSISDEYDYDRNLLKIQMIQRDPVPVPQLSVLAQQKVEKRLREIGVEVLLSHTIVSVNDSSVITDKIPVPYNLFIWTAGSEQSSLVKNSTEFVLSKRKKVVVDSEFKAEGVSDVYVLGDNAEAEFSGLAQIAEQHGVFVGNMLVKKMLNKPYKPFAARKPLYVIPIGARFGLFGINEKVYSGFLPWALRYLVDMRFFFLRLSFIDFISLSIERKLK